MAVLVARGATVAGVTPVLCRLAWLIEVRVWLIEVRGLVCPDPGDKSEGFGWAGRAQGPSIKVRALGGPGRPRARP